MDVQLLRIDSRLLHGQVTTSWARSFSLDYIIIVSDEVARDKIRQSLMLQVKPANINVSIMEIDKMCRLMNNDALNDLKVMVLVETPKDARRLIENGLKMKEINIGSLSFQVGRRMITNSIAVSKEEINDFIWLHQHHVSLYAQKVATDIKKDFWPILKDKLHLADVE